MSRVTYNQRGYDGCSMSVNARLAYEEGEMPKSKWTKKAMLEAIKGCCGVRGLNFDDEITKLKKDELFELFFEWSSWHHTGKFANETDFYQLNEDEVCNTFPKLSEEEIAARKAEEEAEQQAKQEHLRRVKEESFKRHGFANGALVSDVLETNPSLFTRRVSKKGNEMIVWHVNGKERQCLASQAHSIHMHVY